MADNDKKKERRQTRVIWRWLEAEFVPGIPARDLTDEEYAIYSDAIRRAERATGRVLYAKEELTDG